MFDFSDIITKIHPHFKILDLPLVLSALFSGGIRSRDVFRPIVREQKYLIDYKGIYSLKIPLTGSLHWLIYWNLSSFGALHSTYM